MRLFALETLALGPDSLHSNPTDEPWFCREWRDLQSLLIMVSTLVFFLCDKSSIDKTNSYFSFKVEDVQLPVATLDFVSAANFSVP